jgi:ribose transport system substrate-binding protein
MNEMKKLLLLILTFVLVVAMLASFSLVGCKEEVAEETVEEEEVKEEAEEKAEIEKIGYSPLTTQMEYFQRVILGCKSACDERGIELLIDDPQLDLDQQVTGLENLITAGAEALIICSLDPVAVESAVDLAHSKDIPVVSHVSSFENADSYVGLNEYEFGLLGGKTFAEAFKQKAGEDAEIKMAVLASDQLGEGLVQRVQGEIDGILEYYPDAEIVAKADAFDEPTALDTLETMLQANPDINVVICSNDPGAYGAIDAIETSDKKINEEIYVCALGDQFKTLDLIEEGKILSSVSVAPEACGELMVEVAVKLLNNEDVDLNVFTPFEPITIDNVKDIRDYKLSFGPME